MRAKDCFAPFAMTRSRGKLNRTEPRNDEKKCFFFLKVVQIQGSRYREQHLFDKDFVKVLC